MVEVRQPARRPLHIVVVDSIEFGRECDGILLEDDEASRRHLELRARGGRVWASDLGSTNGTTLNGTSVDGEVELAAGDVLVAGATEIRLWAGDETADGRGRRDRSPTLSHAPVDAAPAGRSEVVEPVAPYAGDPVTSIELVASVVDARTADVAELRGDGNTVTVVFSDIESSTEQALQLGDERWFEVLGVHNELIRKRLVQFGGAEIKSQGDGFMLTFPSARRAVQFAIAVQQALAAHEWDHDEAGVRVRIGMHTGEAIIDDDGDLFGKHIIVAARVANLAQGAEILVSSIVREIVSSRDDIAFGPAQTVELKGIADEYIVHPVTWES
jgi:class 3 adenylate cyclase